MSWILIVSAILVAAVECFTAKPKPDEPKWPRWVKLICAFVVAGVGVSGLAEGLYARNAGMTSYKNRDLLTAIEKLNIAYSSPFKNRKVIDYLGLAHKNLGDQAVDGPVADMAYDKALGYFFESRVLFPQAPFAKNAMINVYRRTKNWDELMPLAKSFESEIKSNQFRENRKELSDVRKATFLVTLGNIFADQDNPDRSDAYAVALYKMAQDLDPNNMFVVTNMPPRLIDMAKSMHVESEERYELLKEALQLSIEGLTLEPRDRVFSVLAIIQILMMENSPPVPIKGYSLSQALKVIDENQSARADFDVDTWFILADAYHAIGNIDEAKNAFNQALIYQARFTPEHHDWAKKLWDEFISSEEYPFQTRLSSEIDSHNKSLQPTH